MANTGKCTGCYWYDMCDHSGICDDYTPIEESSDITYYLVNLMEDKLEYEDLVSEMQE